MGERKGQNKYYPPDFDYKKHKSLAGYHGEHPLRERARKMHMGILIIRFEMPYNIWCEGCNKHVAMGVRYNAEKSKIGMYYTTPIYKFRMKCHLCDNHFEIKTDPARYLLQAAGTAKTTNELLQFQNHDYVIISGARRKEQRWDPHENEQIVPEDRATQKKLALDSMYKLEHGANDQSRGKSTAPTISRMVEMQAGHKDDFLLNQLARKQFREVKKVSNEAKLQDEALQKKFSLDVDLVAENTDDARVAELMQFSTVESYDDRQKAKRESIISRPLFPSSDKPASSVPTSTIASSSSSSSSSSSTNSDAVQRKLATLSHIRQISGSSHRTRDQSATSFHSPKSAASTRLKLANSGNVFGVRRRKRDCNQMSSVEPDKKRLRLSDTSASDEHPNSIPDDDNDDMSGLSTDANDEKACVISSPTEVEELPPAVVEDRDDKAHHIVDALSLVSNYNSSSSSSANDSDT